MHDHSPSLPRISEQIWDAKYRLKMADGAPVDLTLADTWARVAAAIAVAEPEADRGRWTKAFAEAMADLAFLPAGRILAGAGAGRAVTLFNCFVMGRIGDDLSSIFANVREAALTMQQGGGIGHDFSTLRPKGAPVKSIGADASGPVSFMDVWDAMCRTIMSAGARRGAMMATLRCDHPDINAFVEAKADPARLRNFNLSVLVTDAFIAAVRANASWDLTFEGKVYRTVDARTLWDRIMRATYDYAEPGVVFIDRVNAENNLGYCETISATNPCVPGDTWVHTADGPRQVSELVGRRFVARVQGQDYASGPAGFFLTGTKPLIRVDTTEGYTLRVTADHRLLVARASGRMETDWCAAGDLHPGDRIVLNDHRGRPVWDGMLTAEQGYLLGLLMGDGRLERDRAILAAQRPAAAVNAAGAVGVDGVMAEAVRAARTLPHAADCDWQDISGRGEYRLPLPALRKLAATLGMGPGQKVITSAVEQTSSAFHCGFLRGLLDMDGWVHTSPEEGVSVRLAQADPARLQAVQRMLLRLGIHSTIRVGRRPAAQRMLQRAGGKPAAVYRPAATRGSAAEYATQPRRELIVSGESLLQLAKLVGFADHEKAAHLLAATAGYEPALGHEAFAATVSAITELGTQDVYDVEVPGINAFDANGMVAHNCGEQPLPPYGACLLGSINLARLIDTPFTPQARLNEERLETLTTTAVRFLDNAIDVSNYPLEAQRQEAKAKRRIGLGVTGLADALILCGVRYGTPEAAAMARRWMATIERAAYRASAELAGEKGAFPLYNAERFLAAPNVRRLPEDVRATIARHGIRNGLLTSIAPTGTISLLAGNVSSGIEPVFDFHYQRRVLERDGTTRTEQVEDYAHALYRTRFGAAAPLTDAFVTAEELTPRAHLEMQAAVQAHVDSSISKTINCPANLSFEAFEDVYLQAYDLGLKGCTTYRPNAVTGAVLSRATPSADAGVGASAGPPGASSGTPDAASESPRPAVPKEPTQVPAKASAPRRPVEAAAGQAGVVYMAEPLKREAVLEGATYKLRWPSNDHALYITINDIERDGRRRPFEVFINTKNLEHYAWTVALTRMISAIFRRGGDVTFVVEELKAIFDPQGGQWMGARYVPSLIAAIGEVIEGHMIRIGFLSGVDAGREPDGDAGPSIDQAHLPLAAGDISPPAPTQQRAGGRTCPRCNMRSLHRREGCWICDACGYSRCG